ncbi:MAG: phosphatidate cytidylyltransferase [Acidimicrobiia bacterium]|nr:phosphatidate cytidylyltransferase [Acidimicrobiia bacterium]MCY4434640.1 phosphatidate cytidylyltransferase [bacterium]
MDEDNPFQRPNDRSEDPPEDEQDIFLDDLTSLFDEEEDDSGLPGWDETESVESEAEETWDSITDAAPRWRDDAEGQSSSDLPDPEIASYAAESVSVFEDPEPTEAVKFPSVDRVDEVLSLDVSASPAASDMGETRESSMSAPSSLMGEARPSAPNGNTMTAIVVGLLLGGIFLGAVALGEKVTLALLVLVLLIAAAEWFTTLRHAGYQPPTLVGFVAVVAMPLAAFWRGADGIVLVLVFALFGAGLWYLGGVGRDRPLANLGVTLFGIAYIGVTGAFGGLLLDLPDGAELVLTAVILTAAHDVGAFAVGRAAGRTPLSRVSPNKTVEGLIGGTILTIAAALVFISILEIGPFGDAPGSRSDGVILGIVVAVVAPLADLMESAIKRDLGIKDMGSLLPGHGGMLDRIDALLFVLPATYFTALMLEVI